MKIKVSNGALEIIRKIQASGKEALVVGGCIRDELLGIKAVDEDITTSMLPQDIEKLFKSSGYKVVPTGIKHGTVSVIIDGKNYEVTTYRKDLKSKDFRHPENVKFVSSLKQDLARRDFTINAIAYDPFKDEIVDYYGGIEDIKNKIIRSVGLPDERIKEDALRMMRAIRFSAQKNMKIDDELFNAIKINCNLISNVSYERIDVELSKILASDNPSDGIKKLHETGILKVIIPELDREFYVSQNNPWHRYDVGNHSLVVLEHTSNDEITRYAALFHDIGKTVTRTTDENGIDHFYDHGKASKEITTNIMKNMRYPNKLIDSVTQIIECHDDCIKSADKKDIIKFYLKHYYLSDENLIRLMDLKIADNYGQNLDLTSKRIEELKEEKIAILALFKEAHRVEELALDGNDILKINETNKGEKIELSPKSISLSKKMLLEYVLNNPEKNNKAELELYLKSQLKQIKNIEKRLKSDVL